MNTHRTPSILLAGMLASLATGAFAEGAYVGGDIGSSTYHSAINGISGKGGQGASLNLYGGYQFTPNLAVEGGLYKLGHLSQDGNTAHTHGVYLDGVASVELAPQLSVLGRLGLAQARFTTTAGDDNSPALKVGAGLEYAMTPKLAWRAEYDIYHATNAFEQKANIGDLSVGLKYSL